MADRYDMTGMREDLLTEHRRHSVSGFTEDNGADVTTAQTQITREPEMVPEIEQGISSQDFGLDAFPRTNDEIVPMLKEGISSLGFGNLLVWMPGLGQSSAVGPLLDSRILESYIAIARSLMGLDSSICPPNHVFAQATHDSGSFRKIFGCSSSKAASLVEMLNDVRREWRELGCETTPATTTITVASAESRSTRQVAPFVHRSYRHYRSVVAMLFIIVSNLVYAGYRAYDAAFNHPRYLQQFGWSLIVARSSAGGAVVATTFLVMLMSRTFVDRAWACIQCRKRVNALLCPLTWMLENSTKCHMVSGVMLAIWAVIHAAVHLSGDMVKYSEWRKEHGYPGLIGDQSYVSLLKSRPAITGYAMLCLIFGICITSMPNFRAARFECFWTVHHSFLVYISLLILHGDGWMRPMLWKTICWQGWPMGWPVIPFTLCWLFERIRRYLRNLEQGACGGCEVTEFFISSSGGHMYIEMAPPPHMLRSYNLQLRPGSYVFMNCPDISRYEWHPFSVASSSSTGRLVLVIAAAGDWTTKLRDHGMELMEASRLHTSSSAAEPSIPTFMSFIGESHRTGPRLDLRVDGSYLAPTAAAIRGSHIVLIGGGVGVTPMMSILSYEIFYLSNLLTQRQRAIRERRVTFIWVTREVEDLIWLRHLLLHVREQAQTCARSLRIRLFFTKKMDLTSPAARLVWACLRADSYLRPSLEIASTIGKLSLGRPNWEEELEAVASWAGTASCRRAEVYVCANKALVDGVKSACDKRAYGQGMRFHLNQELFG